MKKLRVGIFRITINNQFEHDQIKLDKSKIDDA